MEQCISEIEINGVKYVKKGSEETFATSTDGLEYVIIRADRAGVFAGYLESREGTEVELRDVRRLWYWSGAASLSELANKGVKNISACKFPAPNKKIIVTGVVEIIPATDLARKIIEGVPAWSA